MTPAAEAMQHRQKRLRDFMIKHSYGPLNPCRLDFAALNLGTTIPELKKASKAHPSIGTSESGSGMMIWLEE